MPGADDAVLEALRAVARGDDEAVAAAERAAAAHPDDRLAVGLRDHLTAGGVDVYSEPEAFQRFIDGGGNIALYERAGRALAAAHGERRPATVLDIGCGDARLTAASLRTGVQRVDLVEPSAPLLERAVRRLEGNGAEVAGHPFGAGRLATDLPDRRWDLAQATFSLHTIPPDERPAVLADLAGRVDVLLVVEFDAPAVSDRGEDHIRHLAERYTVGLAEYADDPLVARGFLLPVLVAQIAPDATRHTWEQPVAAWGEELRAAGFGTVRHRKVSDYWWAPAHLVEAVP